MRVLSNHEMITAQGGANIFTDTMSAFSDGLTNSEIGMIMLGGAGGLVLGLGLGNQVVVAAVGLAVISAGVYLGYDWYVDKDNTQT